MCTNAIHDAKHLKFLLTNVKLYTFAKFRDFCILIYIEYIEFDVLNDINKEK